jgi:hypothetical protein
MYFLSQWFILQVIDILKFNTFLGFKQYLFVDVAVLEFCSWGYWIPGRRHDEDFPVSVTSLSVPMSPMPVNECVRALIARGLISTERNTLP